MKVPKPKLEDQEIKIPKWYLYKARASLKKSIIGEILKEYEQPVKLTNKQTFQPTDLDVREYMNEILKTMEHSLFMLKGIDVH